MGSVDYLIGYNGGEIMTDQKKRIKLAEAIGWEFEEVDHEYRYCYKQPDGHRDAFRIQCYDTVIPDPFTDANDDYAMLEWMRNEGKGRYDDFCNALAIILDNDHFNYRIGCYARAALKVIE